MRRHFLEKIAIKRDSMEPNSDCQTLMSIATDNCRMTTRKNVESLFWVVAILKADSNLFILLIMAKLLNIRGTTPPAPEPVRKEVPAREAPSKVDGFSSGPSQWKDFAINLSIPGRPYADKANDMNHLLDLLPELQPTVLKSIGKGNGTMERLKAVLTRQPNSEIPLSRPWVPNTPFFKSEHMFYDGNKILDQTRVFTSGEHRACGYLPRKASFFASEQKRVIDSLLTEIMPKMNLEGRELVTGEPGRWITARWNDNRPLERRYATKGEVQRRKAYASVWANAFTTLDLACFKEERQRTVLGAFERSLSDLKEEDLKTMVSAYAENGCFEALAAALPNFKSEDLQKYAINNLLFKYAKHIESPQHNQAIANALDVSVKRYEADRGEAGEALPEKYSPEHLAFSLKVRVYDHPTPMVGGPQPSNDADAITGAPRAQTAT